MLRALSGDDRRRVDVTLIEPSTTYTTCFYSNLYYGGFRSLEVLQLARVQSGAGGVRAA